jgi:glyoxylase-like metal-dependent hydrolase (beta-lactamase superfamily II)
LESYNMAERKIITIGDWRIAHTDTGRFSLDGGAMFGVVPKALWAKTNPSDDLNRIKMALRSLVVKGNNRIILVDCGLPLNTSDKFNRIYAVDHSKYSLDKLLKENDISPNEVTDVIVTHLHFDHAGALSKLDGDERIPTFPNAKIHIQKKHWQHALHPTERKARDCLICWMVLASCTLESIWRSSTDIHRISRWCELLLVKRRCCTPPI